MSTFTCSELANAFNWGACSCLFTPMPTLGSVSNSTFPYSTYGWSQQQKTFAKNECCENACENAANTTPLAEFDAVGTPPTSSGKKPSPLGNRTRSASGMRSVTGRDECGFYPVSGLGFKSQTGEEDIIPAGQIPYQMIYADYETFGTTTCATGIPFDFKCKCDYNNDGFADSLVPLEEVGTAGATIPNYPFPYTLQQSAVISQICCRTYPDGSNAACAQDQQDPTTGLGGGMTTTGKGRRPSGLNGLRIR